MFYFFKSKTAIDLEVSRRTMEACEHILNEMGADIHDDLVQKLSIFRLYLDRLERSQSDPTEVTSLIVSMNADFQEVVSAVRRISRRLMPVRMEDDTFEKRINLLCQHLERPGKGSIHFQATGTEKPIPELAETYLYRIIQELIHNAFKHSAAWHIQVRLTWATDHLLLEVEDDGTSFTKIPELIESLQKKYNTMRMRSSTIGAKIQYLKGAKGLLAKVSFNIPSAL